MFRNTIKWINFIRDPRTWELYYINPVDVTQAVVNEAKGKKSEQYIVKNIDLNMQENC